MRRWLRATVTETRRVFVIAASLWFLGSLAVAWFTWLLWRVWRPSTAPESIALAFEVVERLALVAIFPGTLSLWAMLDRFLVSFPAVGVWPWPIVMLAVNAALWATAITIAFVVVRRLRKRVVLVTLLPVVAYLGFGLVAVVYATAPVIPAIITERDARMWYPHDEIEPHEADRLVGWRTPDDSIFLVESGLLVGYKYQRCGAHLMCLDFTCIGIERYNDVKHTNRLDTVVDIRSRRCIGLIAYRMEYVE